MKDALFLFLVLVVGVFTIIGSGGGGGSGGGSGSGNWEVCGEKLLDGADLSGTCRKGTAGALEVIWLHERAARVVQ